MQTTKIEKALADAAEWLSLLPKPNSPMPVNLSKFFSRMGLFPESWQSRLSNEFLPEPASLGYSVICPVVVPLLASLSADSCGRPGMRELRFFARKRFSGEISLSDLILLAVYRPAVPLFPAKIRRKPRKTRRKARSAITTLPDSEKLAGGDSGAKSGLFWRAVYRRIPRLIAEARQMLEKDRLSSDGLLGAECWHADLRARPFPERHELRPLEGSILAELHLRGPAQAGLVFKRSCAFSGVFQTFAEFRALPDNLLSHVYQTAPRSGHCWNTLASAMISEGIDERLAVSECTRLFGHGVIEHAAKYALLRARNFPLLVVALPGWSDPWDPEIEWRSEYFCKNKYN